MFLQNNKFNWLKGNEKLISTVTHFSNSQSNVKNSRSLSIPPFVPDED